MAIAFIIEIPGVTEQQIAAFTQRCLPGGQAPAGLLYHVGGPTERGWLLVDVWDSPEALQRFAEQATPVARELGIPEAQPTIIQVHDIIQPEWA